jgi:DNA modification methylase/DNA-directed RNA polymerase subunit RPC12/RpoP
MAKKHSTDDTTRPIFRKDDELFDDSLQKEIEEQKGKPVECLGRTFPNDAARREYYVARLREHLQDPEFRKTPGFPKGSDEDILRMSEPPYYTACPNPFVADFVKAYGKPYNPKQAYHRDPFAVDSSVGKSDALYKAHGYHTKVPHLAIVPSILHYTDPGDIVLDGFSGTGMTGVAAQFCGSAPEPYRKQLEQEWKTAGYDAPNWGRRRVILNDLGPAATFISAGYNVPFKVREFERAAKQILKDAEVELGWMYETLHSDGKAKGRINFTVWSEVFACSECGREVVFFEEALDQDTKAVADVIRCPHCGVELRKEQMDLKFESFKDPASGEVHRRPSRRAVLINYDVGKTTYEKAPDAADLKLLDRIASMPLPPSLPFTRLPDCQMTRVGRMATTDTRAVHHMFLPRAAQSLGIIWQHAASCPDPRLRNALLFFVEQAIWTMSVLNRYRPTGYSQVAQYLSGVFYVSSATSELSPWYVLSGKATRLGKVFDTAGTAAGFAAITTGTCAAMPIPAQSVDYIFTDPPFGANIHYSDLNFLVESWHRVWTDSTPEAIVDDIRGKHLHEYQDLMRQCFGEYARVLKPSRWITIVFSNSKNSIWHAIQESLGSAGFVVADVRLLDKQHGSFKQVTSTAVKQDLIISAYKPSDALVSRFKLGYSTPDDAWAFVREHLGNVPVFVKQGGRIQVLPDRTPHMLLDRMTAFHVQRELAVPLSAAEFLEGLTQRFAERDGMYFLSEHVAEYDRKRMTVSELEQLELFVSDEASAIQWLRRELRDKPQSFQDLQPQFMQETLSWAKHETALDLRILLQQNFLCYDGESELPSQIHAYLSSNFKDLRSKPKDDPVLRAKARDRWFVPDPKKSGDLEKLRERELLREFEGYRTNKAKQIKVFRVEAMRAGFKAAYDKKEYATIVEMAEKLPESVLQEDEKMLMYYDVASMRLGDRKDKAELF